MRTIVFPRIIGFLRTPHIGAALAAILLPISLARAAGLIASDGTSGDDYGISVSLSGNIAVVGAMGDDIGSNADQGSAYIFRNLDTVSGTVTQHVKLTASDGASYDGFGYAVSLSGNSALVGAQGDDFGSDFNQGSAYVFRNLDTASGTVIQNVKLTASDAAHGAQFGNAVSLSGDIALVGAISGPVGSSYQGSAYVFRDLDAASGTMTQNVKLTASDGAESDDFGISVSLSGKTALVGARRHDVGSNADQGSAYVFHNLDTANGTVTQNVKLTASDGAANDRFGFSVSLSGSTALVGASADTIDTRFAQGSAYVFRNLDTASGGVTQNVKLIASDGAQADSFGNSVSLSGNTALVGAAGDDVGSEVDQGSAYLFLNLDTASGTITQNIKLIASDGAVNRVYQFGRSVAIDGDNFAIAADTRSYIGKVYTGSVSSLTTLDVGNTTRVINGLSFISQDDWIIGATTDHNQVTLSAGDRADVRATGKSVYIGRNDGSDQNTLFIQGNLVATTVYIGSHDGNVGNSLVLETGATFGTATFRLAEGNFLRIAGDYSDTQTFFSYLNGSSLAVWEDSAWTSVTSNNFDLYLTASFDAGYTTIATAVPEPSAFAALAGLAALGFVVMRRRRLAKGEVFV